MPNFPVYVGVARDVKDVQIMPMSTFSGFLTERFMDRTYLVHSSGVLMIRDESDECLGYAKCPKGLVRVLTVETWIKSHLAVQYTHDLKVWDARLMEIRLACTELSEKITKIRNARGEYFGVKAR